MKRSLFLSVFIISRLLLQWKTITTTAIALKKGENKIRIVFEGDGVNLKSFSLK